MDDESGEPMEPMEVVSQVSRKWRVICGWRSSGVTSHRQPRQCRGPGAQNGKGGPKWPELHCVPKKWAPKHLATATANLHQFKWNFTHTKRHLFLSSTSNFIRIPYSVYKMFNSFKLLSQISVTDTAYFLLTSSVVTGVTSVRVDKQTTCYQKRIEF